MDNTLLSNVKTMLGIDAEETVYDSQIGLQIRTAIDRLKMAGINATIGQYNDGKIITVANFKVGEHVVGEIILDKKTNERALEFIVVHVQRMIYQDAQTSFYATLNDLEHELLTTMSYSVLEDNLDE